MTNRHTESDSSADLIVNRPVLRPLFSPNQEPNQHRIADNIEKYQAKVIPSRRPSQQAIVNCLRREVGEWRKYSYPGASETSRRLLSYWFSNAHQITDPYHGNKIEFRYYFCQREAIETLIYLIEVRQVRSLAGLISEFDNREDKETIIQGINPEEDSWPSYAFKLATGTGKTKCMSLAIVWSYFHNLYEIDSSLACHFVILAPNLTVFERLREDFRPEIGGQNIFDKDPLIPPEWRTDWNFSVVLQDEPMGASAGGILYLTNIHRLFPKATRSRKAETYNFAGPPVSKATALDTAQELRQRIASHSNLMIMNDEAHHVWDPDSAWNEAIKWLTESLDVTAQLDFSATPRDAQGNLFRHIVCDTPLGEAVDAGIVKTPIIGHSEIEQRPSDDASERYDMHLRIGYERWKKSHQEWSKSNRKPLLFVMCESTAAADQIAKRLNTDKTFKKLNGKTINLHTNLKGKIRKIKKGSQKIEVFEENEKQISDEDLKALRRLSRELDQPNSPYLCIVSVLMLREGWDVRNVTTIVPLRPFSAASKILPEQTLGRGLRRMTPADGSTDEVVVVVEHPSFINLYDEGLVQEGLPISSIRMGDIKATTVSIFPDPNKDCNALDISLPQLSPSISIAPSLQGLKYEQIQEKFKEYSPLPLGKEMQVHISYEGSHFFTKEIVEEMKIYLPLLEKGITAISYFVKQLEKTCRIQNSHKVLAPLLQRFLSEDLFGEKVELTDSRLVSRLAKQDVAQYIYEVFAPLIRKHTVKPKKPRLQDQFLKLSDWRPYQVTQSDSRPVVQAEKTLFNLVPCIQALEHSMTKFLDKAPDIVSFAKNAGPQALRIDYVTAEHSPAFYIPDFFARDNEGKYFLIETKGRQDRDVLKKASAAVQWCQQVSNKDRKWQYVYVQEQIMRGLSDNHFSVLSRACEPALKNLLSQETPEPELPLYDDTTSDSNLIMFFGQDSVGDYVRDLSPSQLNLVRQAVDLFLFLENKQGDSLAPVFTTLLGPLDAVARDLIVLPLRTKLPNNLTEQNNWFAIAYPSNYKRARHYKNLCGYLKRGILHDELHSPLGRLRDCIDYALNSSISFGGVFEAVREAFNFPEAKELLDHVQLTYDFRNTRVAHNKDDKSLLDREETKRMLKEWVKTLARLSARLKATHLKSPGP